MTSVPFIWKKTIVTGIAEGENVGMKDGDMVIVGTIVGVDGSYVDGSKEGFKVGPTEDGIYVGLHVDGFCVTG